MTLPEFQALILAQGDKLCTWSEPQQHGARELLGTSSEAVDLLAEAVRLREALQSQGDVKAPEGLKNRIFRAAFASVSEKRLSASGSGLRGSDKAFALI